MECPSGIYGGWLTLLSDQHLERIEGVRGGDEGHELIIFGENLLFGERVGGGGVEH